MLPYCTEVQGYSSICQTILLIDGDHYDRDFYVERLRKSLPGYVVIPAITGRMGLAICERQQIDCVILELDLPDMSGFEVLLKLVPDPRHPHIPVIILTRLGNPHLLDAAISNGAQAALDKRMASGDILDKTILKAITAIPQKSKGLSHLTV